MATVKCVWGAPCSGKSTYIQKNAKKGDLVFDYDAVRKALTLEGGHAKSTDAQKQMINKMRYTYATSAADSEVDTAWFVCLKPSEYIRVALGEDTEYIKMDVSKEECLQRLEKDDTRPDKQAMKELIEQYFADEEQPEVQRNMKEDREYRSMELRMVPVEEGAEPSFFVEGYASTFQPYTLMTVDDIDYKEQIMPDAFNDADMSDVVFRVDHTGPVYARTSAGSLEVWTDEHGLAQKTDLGMTARGRELYADIAAGNYPQMSFAFSVAEDHYDKATHTRIIDRIAKVYDVSPVCFPANPTTELSISTRDYFNGVIEAERAERLEAEKREIQKKRIKLLSEVH